MPIGSAFQSEGVKNARNDLIKALRQAQQQFNAYLFLLLPHLFAAVPFIPRLLSAAQPMNRRFCHERSDSMYSQLLMRAKIFQNIPEANLESLLKCLGAYERVYGKGEIIYSAGSTVSAMGLVLKGQVLIEQTDLWGNSNIFGHAGPGQVFAETYACVSGEKMLVDAIAAQESTILFLDIKKVLHTCPASCGFHSQLISNLLTVISVKNLNLSRKINYISHKSIRDRLLSYLSFQAVQQGSHSFEIPFNRQELADYLCVDRSALSNELSKMKREGLLSCTKNKFELFVTPGNNNLL